LAYSPKYTSIDKLKSAVYPQAEKLSDPVILDAIESGERETDDWLVSVNIDPKDLSGEELNAAKDIALCYSVLWVIPKLPVAITDMRELETKWREQLVSYQRNFIQSLYPKFELKTVFRRIGPGYGREYGEDV